MRVTASLDPMTKDWLQLEGAIEHARWALDFWDGNCLNLHDRRVIQDALRKLTRAWEDFVRHA